MKTDTRADIPDTEGTPGKALKRRGLIAGAAALVAGMVAKQTSQPVAAVAAMNYASVSGDYVQNFTHGVTKILSDVPFTGPDATFIGQAYGGNSTCGIQGVIGLRGQPAFPCGVFGEAGTPNSVGVYGKADSGTGVRGEGGGAGGIGVVGQSDAADQIGVIGVSAAGVGVKGVSTNGFPLIGVAIANTNPAPGMLGLGTAGPGVQGQSGTSHGLIGYTGASDGHAGLVGYGIYAGSVGLIGVAPGYGTGTVGNAGVFYGNVHIQGIFDAPQMRAVVKHQGDGTYRALHTLATPEGWVEDFGTGTLAADKADITLDHDFVALIDPGTLHVFLTPHGPQHLHVAQQSAAGFTVIATPVGGAGGPKRAEGTGTFAWRVVGKRKDIATGRLAKVAAPTAPKALASFTIPETPVVTTPDVKNAPGGKSPTDRP